MIAYCYRSNSYPKIISFKVSINCQWTLRKLRNSSVILQRFNRVLSNLKHYFPLLHKSRKYCLVVRFQLLKLQYYHNGAKLLSEVSHTIDSDRRSQYLESQYKSPELSQIPRFQHRLLQACHETEHGLNLGTDLLIV